MPSDVPPVPAERQALDRPWRLWASSAIVSFVVVSLAIGFVVLPGNEEAGFDPWASICRAIGIPGYAARQKDTGAEEPGSTRRPSQFAWTSGTRTLVASGNAERGAEVAKEVCAACHGEGGIAVDPAFPNLANQSATVFIKQMNDYKTGSRRGGQAEVMTTLVQELTEQQMADVAAFYESRTVEPRVRAASGVLLSIDHLARLGDPARGLAACEACHGARRDGPKEAPALLGQSLPYLELQLQLFASGERQNDLFSRMRVIANQLTPEEMRALAIYYRGMAVPRYKQ